MKTINDLVKKLAWNLAYNYSLGWKSYQYRVTEIRPLLTPEEWADANWEAYAKKASRILSGFIKVKQKV